MGHTHMNFLKRFFSSLLLLSFIGAGCTQAPDAATVAASKPKTLVIWGVVDDLTPYDEIFNSYRKIAPNISIEYRRFRLEDYESALLNALAEDRGPDIFMMHNTWVGKYMPKILPMPLSVKIATKTVQGTLKKETVWQLNPEKLVSLRQFKEEYLDAVSKDMIRNTNISTDPDKKDFQDRIMGMPLSVDTLALYVNKDLLNAAGIANIPQTWDIFQEAVKRLVKLDDTSALIQAGVAMGTGANVNRSADILQAIMMQNGAEMSKANGSPTFAVLPEKLSGERDIPPGNQAVSFYTDFANPAKDNYSWNKKMPNSLEAFTSGKVAFMLGYSYDLPTIKARAPKLNLAISKFPQIAGNPEANIANYWAWTVSKKTKSSDIAWHFVNYMHQPEQAKLYLKVVKRPAALRALLPAQLDDEDIGVFAAQVLNAQSWYRGNDAKATEDAFIKLIDTSIGVEPEVISKNIHDAQNIVSQTYAF